MTHVADDGTVFIEQEPAGRCELCGSVEETRPYGPNGEQVCWDCGMKDPAAAFAQFRKRIGCEGPADPLPKLVIEGIEIEL